MNRIFIKRKNIHQNSLSLSKFNSHYLKTVLRLKSNHLLELIVDEKELWVVKVKNWEKSSLIISTLKKETLQIKNTPKITLLQCLPKQDKFSDICRKCTEIGIKKFTPLKSTFTLNNPSQNKEERWKEVVLNAACQSKQVSIPKVNTIQNLNDLIENYSTDPTKIKLIGWEHETRTTLKTALKKLLLNTTNKKSLDILLLIGAEGGFSKEEVNYCQERGFTSFSLGKTILRAENAAYYTCACIQYELNE